ncbi:MAG: rsmG [Anaerocolumna sp.]|jgi:16S rRNA (guanine527-N7)-methyltransferase|nr:rsmG [Anaerocolumna sp.]
MDKLLAIKEEVSKIGIELSDVQVNQFMAYYNMLIEKNKVMNLTAITDFDDVLRKHFVDSLCINKAYDFSKDIKLLDLGTGAGFPGIPLKIAFPNIKIVLMDSLNKRLKFLNDVIKELDLKDIITVHGRAEEMGINALYREDFDVCVSRAVAKLSSLTEYCLPFVRVGGSFIAYKSDDISLELDSSHNAISILGGKFKDKVSFTLPGSDIQRTLVVIEKKKFTPKKYPRQAGKPNKEPL